MWICEMIFDMMNVDYRLGYMSGLNDRSIDRQQARLIGTGIQIRYFSYFLHTFFLGVWKKHEKLLNVLFNEIKCSIKYPQSSQ